MALDRFMIGPFDKGLQTDLKPWMIPDEAFSVMNNAYVFRGRVKKRFGSTLTGQGWANTDVAHLHSRLRINLGNTNGAGLLAGNVPGAKFKVGQSFSVGTTIFTVITAGAGVQMLRTDGSIEVATYNTANGAYSITIAAFPATPVYFYPTEPVMGLDQYESGSIYNEPTLAFDTQFAYYYTGDYWLRSGTGLWHGGNLDYFWSTNWMGVSADKASLFASNFQVTNKNGIVVAATDDPIWTYDGATWTTFSPLFKLGGLGATNYIVSTARIIVPFKNRLLLLNTVETDNTAAPALNKHYPNRCRFSHNGSPFPAATAWLEPNQAGADGAGWVDAPTEEQIVSIGFIKDRLIVYFEASTWELAYTGNQILPFVWQKLNSELGSDAVFSSVPFDKVVLTVGNTGIHGCNGSNVERIDNPIPDEVFKIRDKNNGTTRVAGIRDYFTEMVYWTFPSANEVTTQEFCNKVFVYNYKNNTWSFNDDSITVFGYFEQQSDYTWEDMDEQWSDAHYPWNSAVIQANFKQVLAGNQQGYVFLINSSVARNAPVMYISNMAYVAGFDTTQVTVLDHNLIADDYVYIEHTACIPGIWKVESVASKDIINIYQTGNPGVYLGGGTIARVSKIDIYSKDWNPYVDKDYAFHLAKIDFNVDKTSSGQVTVDYFPSYSGLSMLDEASLTNARLGTGILGTTPYALIPMEANQTQLWHAVFFQTEGDSIRIRIYLTDDQMEDPLIALSDFEMNAMILYTRKTSSRL